MKLRIIAIFATAVLLIGAAPLRHGSGQATNAPPPSGRAVGFLLSDWHVSTGELDVTNYEAGDFTAPVPLTLSRPGSSIQADRAVGNFKRKQATLTGHVVLHDSNGVLTNFAGQGGSRAPATLTCDTLQIDGVTKTYTATGNVHYSQGGSEVRADRAVMNGITHDLHLYGNVQLQQ
jgi:lipopolysaccharide assembly outer membrane protein LptD (OstA)